MKFNFSERNLVLEAIREERHKKRTAVNEVNTTVSSRDYTVVLIKVDTLKNFCSFSNNKCFKYVEIKGQLRERS